MHEPSVATNSIGLWNEEDGFSRRAEAAGWNQFPMKIRSMVGLIPPFAVETWSLMHE